ncbi:MAG TPA: SH3 domain-containing protein [Gemmatimonadales bacterium]|nr:SH3 domain-containing protein [Gemmatimonadales bacterium]
MIRRRQGLPFVALVLAACAANGTPDPPPPAAAPVRHAGAPAPAAPATARDSALEQRAARLELRLAERDAEVEELRARLDEAREEVVRTLAKLQTVASRAEAASAMAEAEIAVQGLRAAAGTQGSSAAEVEQAGALLQQASAEFGKQNYGGALYLANQSKRAAGLGGTRPGGNDRPSIRPGEVAFAVAVPLQAVARGKIREGPGSTYRVLFTVEPGAALTGYSYVDQWVRVADDNGHAGWMFVTLVGRRG